MTNQCAAQGQVGCPATSNPSNLEVTAVTITSGLEGVRVGGGGTLDRYDNFSAATSETKGSFSEAASFALSNHMENE